MNIRPASKLVFKILSRFILLGSIFLIIVFSTPSSEPNKIYAALLDYSKTWQTDADWQAWTKQNVELRGANQGLQLSKNSSGQYYSFGEINYTLEPGRTAKWGTISSSIENGIVAPTNNTLWIPVYDRDSVTQMDAQTGAIVREWLVGDDPSKTAVGCSSSDVWVANASQNTGTTAGLKDSISHIDSSKGTVVTRKVFASESGIYPNGIATQCLADGTVYVWVVLYNNQEVVVINGNNFDSLPATSAATVLSRIPVGFRPNGAAFDAEFKYLYLLDNISDAGDAGRIDVSRRILDRRIPVANRPYSLAADPYGNIWLSTWNSGSLIQRIGRDGIARNVINLSNYHSAALCEPTSVCDWALPLEPANPGYITGIEYMPAAFSNQTSDRLYLVGNGTPPAICYADLNTNGTARMFHCRRNDAYGGGPGPGGERGRAVAFNKSGDVWAVTLGKLAFRYLMANDYSSSRTTDMFYVSSDHAAQANPYSNLLGNGLYNASDNIDFLFSTEPFDSTHRGVTDPSTLGESEKLYIKLIFKGGPDSSPILRSFTINYQINETGTEDMIVKSTFSNSARSARKATFEAGDSVYVRLEVYERLDSNNDFEITDFVALSVGQVNNIIFRLSDGTTRTIGTRAPSSGKLIFNGRDAAIPALIKGRNVIEFDYKI